MVLVPFAQVLVWWTKAVCFKMFNFDIEHFNETQRSFRLIKKIGLILIQTGLQKMRHIYCSEHGLESNKGTRKHSEDDVCNTLADFFYQIQGLPANRKKRFYINRFPKIEGQYRDLCFKQQKTLNSF